MPAICPKCGAANPQERHTCRLCGAELEAATLSGLLGGEIFGPPRRLKNRYTVQRAISQGARANVYRATDTQTGQPCLVHQTSLTALDMDMREVLEQQFLQKAARWQTIDHPNILAILDADVQHHRLYLITAPVRGRSLRATLRDRNALVAEQTLLRWGEQLCNALEYLHNQKPPLVLGCLSPSAIHVASDGQIQIAQVGLIRYDRSGLFGPAKGVPGYAAPEQKKGQVTPLTDIYTLGIILYHIITRFDPRERPLPALKKYGAAFSSPLIEAIVKAYRRDPARRYPSAAAMRDALLASSPIQTIHLPPFQVAEGKTVTTIPDLAQACAERWDEGLLALINGRIAGWLAQAADELRQTGQTIQAEQIAHTAERTRQAQEQMTRQARPGREEIAHNAALAAWLQDLGAMGIQPSLEVKPLRFDFGIVAPTVRAKSAIQIRNQGRGYLSGRVESRLPWIDIPQPAFGCHAGETARVRVEARGKNLPLGDSRSPQAIRVLSNGGDVWIQAQAASSPPRLDVQPHTLNYGPITRGAARVAHLILSNKGGGRLSGRVTSKAPWLRIRRPNFSCPAGASARIAVELLGANLPKRAVRIRRALIIDSDSGQATIDIAWKWARPALELDTLSLDFESTGRGQVRRTVTLSNSGAAELIGEIRSLVPWLNVQPAAFKCAPGASQRIEVICDAAQLPGGSTVEAEAIAIEANAGAQTLSASVEIMAPQLTLDTTTIDLGTIRDDERAEAELMIGNHGSTPWSGWVRPTVDWLTVEPDQVVCEAGHSIPVTVMVNLAALPHGGEWRAGDAIRVQGSGEKRLIGARVFLSRPQLRVERRSIDFGLIGRTDIVTLPLEIANQGTGELHWRVETRGAWIEIVPSGGVCQTGETATIEIKAYALAVSGESDQAWITIRSNGGRIDLPARVGLSSPELAVEPLSVALKSVNYEPDVQTVSIFNRGVGKLAGAVASTVPWLTASPTEFECDAGMSTQIQVQANLQEIKEGVHEAFDGLRITSNAGEREIDVRLTLTLTPRLHVAATELLFEREQTQTLLLENQGYGNLRVQLAADQDWIVFNRRHWTIKAQKKAGVVVSLDNAPDNAQGSIEISATDKNVRIPIQTKFSRKDSQ